MPAVTALLSFLGVVLILVVSSVVPTTLSVGDTCSVTEVGSIKSSMVAMVTTPRDKIGGRFVGVTAGDSISRVDGVREVGRIEGMAV